MASQANASPDNSLDIARNPYRFSANQDFEGQYNSGFIVSTEGTHFHDNSKKRMTSEYVLLEEDEDAEETFPKGKFKRRQIMSSNSKSPQSY